MSWNKQYSNNKILFLNELLEEHIRSSNSFKIKINMKSKLIANIIFILSSVSCVSTSKTSSDLPIIYIESSLKDFKVSELSSYAKSIRYVPLETTSSSLVSNHINGVYLENNLIFVSDEEPFLKVFDAQTGKYLYNIGSRGQGPGELPHMNAVDINPLVNKVLLCWDTFVHQFDFDGSFISKIELPTEINETERPAVPVVMLEDNYLASIIYVAGDQTNLVYIFNESQEIIDGLKCYDNPIQHEVFKAWSPFDQGGLFYRSDKEVRYYRAFTDTIYSYNNDKVMFEPNFIIDYGKHKSKLDFNPDSENSNLIKISSICENKNYVFLYFDTKRSSPQPYEDEGYRIGGPRFTFTNQSILGVLDKHTQSFHFLQQPVFSLQGFRNDLDNGLPFRVKNTSTEGQLIDYHHAYKFLENVDKLTNTSESFDEVVNKISEDDNPIVIIAE